ncbi:MAG: winged helix DNA-binding protein [Alphaproteobacteria bacterium]
MTRRAGKTPIVSSAHLASDHGAELNEFEFGLIVAANAFNRWVARCMAAAGPADLSALDALVLHGINHRDRPKRAADLCFVLNIEDAHLVTYACKKLERLGLVRRGRKGKEVFYAIAPAGREACARYRRVREDCLVEALDALGLPERRDIGETARLLRALSGLYDQAARAATSL